MNQFKKETRYIVLKLSKLTIPQKAMIGSIIPALGIGLEAMPECVVVEHDWPNYGETWDTIESVAENNYVSRDQLQAERDALAAQVASLKALVKEEAYEAYWSASDDNRADRWDDKFDDSVRRQFEKYWESRQHNHDSITPAQCLLQVKANTLQLALHEVANQYDGNDTSNYWCIGANHVFVLFAKYAEKIQQGGE